MTAVLDALLRRQHGDELVFATFEAARAALDVANGARLHRLKDEELAA